MPDGCASETTVAAAEPSRLARTTASRPGSLQKSSPPPLALPSAPHSASTARKTGQLSPSVTTSTRADSPSADAASAAREIRARGVVPHDGPGSTQLPYWMRYMWPRWKSIARSTGQSRPSSTVVELPTHAPSASTHERTAPASCSAQYATSPPGTSDTPAAAAACSTCARRSRTPPRCRWSCAARRRRAPRLPHRRVVDQPGLRRVIPGRCRGAARPSSISGRTDASHSGGGRRRPPRAWPAGRKSP